MDVSKMIADLRQERDHLDEVIMSLERLARGQGKRRGRPPAWLKAGGESSEEESTPTAITPKKRGRPAGAKNKKRAASQQKKPAAQTEESVAE
jgi:hypothetical protein